jgi:hypothetical protein
MRPAALIAAIAIAFAPGFVLAQSKMYAEQVFLDSLDETSNTYSGRIIVAYKLCNEARFGAITMFDKVTAIIPFDRAKDAQDAKRQKQADVDRIIADVAKDAKLCPLE